MGRSQYALTRKMKVSSGLFNAVSDSLPVDSHSIYDQANFNFPTARPFLRNLPHTILQLYTIPQVSLEGTIDL
jgi:hypothetical protein